MSEQNTKLYLSVRDRGLSISIFKREKVDVAGDGKLHTSYGACLQRSYKPKDSEEYKNENINLFPDELLKMSNLCLRAYNELTGKLQAEKSEQKSDTPSEYPAQSMDDEVPFN